MKEKVCKNQKGTEELRTVQDGEEIRDSGLDLTRDKTDLSKRNPRLYRSGISGGESKT